MLKHLIIIFSFISLAINAQDIRTVNNRVTINFQDYFVYARIKNDGATPRPRNKVNYYWYSSNDIKKTRGGYEGKLLDGVYTEFYPNKDLKAKGKFKNGHKKGKWKYWNPNGQYKEVIRWRWNGKVGKFKSYDNRGTVIKKGKYKNDLYHGIIKEREGRRWKKHKYKRGEEIILDIDNKDTEGGSRRSIKERLFRFKKNRNDSGQENPESDNSTNGKKSKGKNNEKSLEGTPTQQIEKKPKKEKKKSLEESNNILREEKSAEGKTPKVKKEKAGKPVKEKREKKQKTPDPVN